MTITQEEAQQRLNEAQKTLDEVEKAISGEKDITEAELPEITPEQRHTILIKAKEQIASPDTPQEVKDALEDILAVQAQLQNTYAEILNSGSPAQAINNNVSPVQAINNILESITELAKQSTNTYGEQIKQLTQEIETNPFTPQAYEKLACLLANEDIILGYSVSDNFIKNQEEQETANSYKRLFKIADRAAEISTRIVQDILNGKFLVGLSRDPYGYPDITPIFNGYITLQDENGEEVEIDVCQRPKHLNLNIENPYPWHEYAPDETRVNLVKVSAPYQNLTIHGRSYTAPYFFVHALYVNGYDTYIDKLLKQTQKKTRGANKLTQPKIKVLAIDQVTNALFNRNANHVEPWEYMTDWEENHIVKVSGKNQPYMQTPFRVRIDETVDIADTKLYQANSTDLYWYQLLYNYVREYGELEVLATDLLKLAGYKKPCDVKNIPAITEIYSSLKKLSHINFWLDTTEENKAYQQKGRPLTPRMTETALLHCSFEFVGWEDKLEHETKYRDIKIFVWTPPNYEKPTDALPILAYADEKGMLIEASEDDYTFKSVKIRGTEARIIWGKVLKHARSKYINKDVKSKKLEDLKPLNMNQVFEDLLFDEDLDKALRQIKKGETETEAEFNARKKKEQRRLRKNYTERKRNTLNNLEKMLEERKQQGRIDYLFNEDRTELRIKEL